MVTEARRLYAWWAVVDGAGIWSASDFFHVARLVAFLELWRLAVDASRVD